MDAVFDAVAAIFEAVGTALKVVLILAGTFLLTAILGLLASLVARDYWNWFVSPLGLPSLSLLHAWGLVIFVGLLRGQYAIKPPADDESESVPAMVLRPLFALGTTWVLGLLISTIAGPF